MGWWSDDPTIAQLDKHTDSFKEDPFLEGLAREWRARDKEVTTLKDLISCYYCGIKIICVPHMNAAPSRISGQYKKLQGLIKEASEETFKMRQNAELLMNSEELDIYFSYAFNHFSQNPTKPFDFVNAAFQHSPIEATFKYHILKSATRLMETGQFESDYVLFDELAPLVASSILLDVCRKGYPLKSMGSRIASVFRLGEYANSVGQSLRPGKWYKTTKGSALLPKRSSINIIGLATTETGKAVVVSTSLRSTRRVTR